MIHSIKITSRERETGHILPDNLAEANGALRQDGIVVLEDVVETSHLHLVRERMARDLDEILSQPDAPFQFNKGNVQQDPPPFEPFLFRDILVNDIVIAVTKSILGAGLKNIFYSGNTALPSASRQPVHADTGQLWPDLETATPAYQLVVNIPMVDMSEQNGSTEIWPGTHLDTTVAIQAVDLKVPDEALQSRRAIAPPLQPAVKLGSVVIRDIRLWHAGMPNHTKVPRPMIAMIHSVTWWPDSWVTFAKGSEPFLAHSDLRTMARYVNSPVDYLHHHTAHDLQK